MISKMLHVTVQVINPPLLGVIAGVIVGLSPAGPLLFLAPSPSASRMPFELKIVVGKEPCRPHPPPVQAPLKPPHSLSHRKVWVEQ